MLLKCSPWLHGRHKPKSSKICKNVEEIFILPVVLDSCLLVAGPSVWLRCLWKQCCRAGQQCCWNAVLGFMVAILDFISKGLVDRPKLCRTPVFSIWVVSHTEDRPGMSKRCHDAAIYTKYGVYFGVVQCCCREAKEIIILEWTKWSGESECKFGNDQFKCIE